jgi:hypothetical protein
MLSSQPNCRKTSAWFSLDEEYIRSTPDNVASASSIGRVIKRSISSGVEPSYGTWMKIPGNSISGNFSRGSSLEASIPTSASATKITVVEIGRRIAISVCFISAPG